MKAHVEPSCHIVFSVCSYRRGFIIMWSYSEISAERSQAFWKRLNLFDIWLKKSSSFFSIKKEQVGKDQEKVQSEKDSHSKNRGGKKTN